MYGTITRARLKAGAEPALKALMDDFEARQVAGYIGQYTYRMDADPNVYMSAVIFTSKEAYFANANAPEQHAFYERMVALFEGEPEWFDGEITDVRGAVARG
jgi:hypothetical protein